MMESTSTPRPSNLVYLATLSAFMGAISMGCVVGWSAPAFDDMAREDSVPQLKDNDDSKSWIGSCIALGALFGGLLGGPFSELIGRKKALVLYGFPLTAGWIIIFTSNTALQIIIGRTLTGFCIGLVSGTAPTYVTEISTPAIRGTLGTYFQLLVTIGLLIAFIFGAFLTWSSLTVVLMIPSILLSLMMFFMPESPIWCVMKQDMSAARESLNRLRTKVSDIEKELKQIEDTMIEKTSSKFSLRKVFKLFRKPDVYKPLFLSFGLMFFQQFTGINAIIIFVTDIFKQSGVSIKPSSATILVGIAQTLATVVNSLLIDRVGRKVLLYISSAGEAIACGVLGYYYYHNQPVSSDGIMSSSNLNLTSNLDPNTSYFSSNISSNLSSNISLIVSSTMATSINSLPLTSSSFAWVPVACLIIYIISMSLGFGPIPWMMIPEMTPNSARSIICAMSTALVWAFAFLITLTFVDFQNAVTPAGTFWSYCFMAILSLAFVKYLLPETKGKTIGEISRGFTKEITMNDLNKNRVGKETELSKLRA